jgi:hypothetical protein
VYFPLGSGEGWVDYFNPNGTTVYKPGTNASINTPDEILPVFQQVGSVVPLAFVGESGWGDVIRLRAVAPAALGKKNAQVTGPASEPAWIYDDDGRTTRYSTHGEWFRAEAAIDGKTASSSSTSSSSSSSRTFSVSLRVTHAAYSPRWNAAVWEVAVPGEGSEAIFDVISVQCAEGWSSVKVSSAVHSGGAVVAV